MLCRHPHATRTACTSSKPLMRTGKHLQCSATQYYIQCAPEQWQRLSFMHIRRRTRPHLCRYPGFHIGPTRRHKHDHAVSQQQSALLHTRLQRLARHQDLERPRARGYHSAIHYPAAHFGSARMLTPFHHLEQPMYGRHHRKRTRRSTGPTAVWTVAGTHQHHLCGQVCRSRPCFAQKSVTK